MPQTKMQKNYEEFKNELDQIRRESLDLLKKTQSELDAVAIKKVKDEIGNAN